MRGTGLGTTTMNTIQDAISAFVEQRYDDAEKMCRELIATGEQVVTAHTLLARTLMNVGNAEEALRVAHAGTRLGTDDADAFAAFGDALRMLGDLEHAADVYHHAVLLAPDRSELALAYGHTLLAAGDHQGATRQLLRAVALEPNAVPIYPLLADALLAQGRASEAIEAYETALAFAPDDPQLCLQFGLWCRNNNMHERALTAFRSVTRMAPDSAAGPVNTGITLRALGRAEEAASAARAALALLPDLAIAHANLGLALSDLKRYDDSIHALQQAHRLAPGSAEIAYKLGTTLVSARRPDEGQAMLESALALSPDDAAICANLGTALLIQGRVDEAGSMFERATDCDPTLARPWLQLARMGREIDTAALEHIVANPITPGDRTDAHFALGTDAHKNGDHEEAFTQWTKGNLLGAHGFDVTAHEVFADRLIETFQDTVARNSDDPEGPVPVFIVGLPRSGTSLVEQMLAAHPDVIGLGERMEIRECSRAAANTFGRGSKYPEFVPSLDDQQLRLLGQAYSMKLEELMNGERFFIDKMPGNAMHLGFIHAMFPGAPIIHCRRNPLDVALSNFKHRFQRGDVPWSYDLGHIAAVMNTHERVMNLWDDVLPGRVLHVDYESLVSNPEPMLRKVAAHCGLTWEDAMLAPESVQRPVFTASSSDVRKPVHTGSVGNAAPYATMLQPLIDALSPTLRQNCAALECVEALEPGPGAMVA
ncbi:MAG: tetratricopeptide (TPR) repeat protein [Bradymonadia bacterium]|jgi:tetratricopeptide (TPR) repeat protein